MKNKTDSTNDAGSTKLEKKIITCRLGQELVYYTSGNGPTLVLITGYGVDVKTMDKLVNFFSETYKVVTWECRGISEQLFIDSSHEPNFSMDNHSHDLKEILDNESSTEVDIIAWSSGPKVALNFNYNYPSYVRSFSFIAGNFTPLQGYENLFTEWDTQFEKIARAAIKKQGLANLLAKNLAKSIEDKSIDNLYGDLSEEYYKIIFGKRTNGKAFSNYCNTIIEHFEHDISKYVAHVDIPTFFISAKHDKVSHPKQSEIMAKRIRGSQHHCFADSNHWLVMEEGEKVAKIIEQFLETRTND